MCAAWEIAGSPSVTYQRICWLVTVQMSPLSMKICAWNAYLLILAKTAFSWPKCQKTKKASAGQDLDCVENEENFLKTLPRSLSRYRQAFDNIWCRFSNFSVLVSAIIKCYTLSLQNERSERIKRCETTYIHSLLGSVTLCFRHSSNQDFKC